jgi:hypothetical protein
MDVSALKNSGEEETETEPVEAEAAAPSGSGVYATLREHAKTLVELADQVAEDAQGEGGLHDKPAELLAVILVQARGVADLIEILADFEEEEDAEDAAGETADDVDENADDDEGAETDEELPAE